MKPIKIAVSAGELSGDEHAAKVIAALNAMYPALEVKGMGGRNLRQVGVHTVIDSETSASVMGFGDVVRSLGRVVHSLNCMKRLISTWKPDCLLLIDYADFNMRLARFAKSKGVKVLYYIPPQIWAWRKRRAKVLGKLVDQAAVIFPFEKQFYESQGFSQQGFSQVTFVGHPFVNALKTGPSEEDRARLCGELDLDPQSPLIAIFPGSRRHEIKQHLLPMVEALAKLRKSIPNAQGMLSLSHGISELMLSTLPPYIKVVRDESYNVLRSCDAGLLKSGTSNLQAAFAELPFVMFYRAPKIAELIVRNLIHISEYSIVNVIRPNTVEELIQEGATAEAAAASLKRLLLDSGARNTLKAKLQGIVQSLASYDNLPGFSECEDASSRVALLILKLTNVKPLSASFEEPRLKLSRVSEY